MGANWRVERKFQWEVTISCEENGREQRVGARMFHFFIRYLFLELMSCALEALTVIQSSVVGQPFSAC